MNNFKKR